MDVVVPAENEGATLYRNDLDSPNHWLRLRPVTGRSAPGGFNTIFQVTAGGVTQDRELMAEMAHASQGDNMIHFGLGSNTVAEVTAHWQRGGSTTIFAQPGDVERLVHETVIDVNGEIDGTVQEGGLVSMTLHGPPGAIAIAAADDPAIPIGLPLPSGGAMDIWPNFAFFKVAFLNGAGTAPWTLGPVPVGQGYVGLGLDFQMVTLNPFTSVYETKSGLSSVTVVP